MQRRFLGKHRDNNKVAAMAMMIAGQATVSEVARLAGTSRQRVQHWAKWGDYKGPPWPKKSEPAFDLDVKAARNALLEKQWAAEIEKLEAEDREANTEQEWQALKALQATQRKPKPKPRRR
jgi:hypothetical protein